MPNDQRSYSNPVLRGFYPDPSVVRVGEDYYLANSTFQYWPGVAISHSRDLVHWRTIGHAAADGLDLSDLADSHGIWAPDLSYRDGVFSVYATLRLNNPPAGVKAPLRRQLLMRSTRPEGPYSPPVAIEVDDIDPSLFVDDDGLKYMAISPGISLVPLDADGGRPIGPPVVAWPGTGRRCPEGPRLYKRNGYYYAVLAEGGTGWGHCVTVARSRALFGPYEECPFNPVLTQSDPAAPIQRAGHGCLVDTPAGDWWMLYLCGRPNGGPYTTLGRETALDPVEWTDDGWFVVNGGRGPSRRQTAPKLPAAPWPQALRDDFDAPVLGPDWQFVRNPDAAAWSLSDRPGFYRIRTGPYGLDSIAAKNTLLRRETAFRYAAELRLEFAPEADGPEAGLACYYGTRNYLSCGLVRAAGAPAVRLTENRNGAVAVLGSLPWPAGAPVRLRVEVDGQTRRFLAAADGGPWLAVGAVEDASYLSDEGVLEGKHHTGTLVGMYANSGGKAERAAADFDWFDYRPLDDDRHG
jgi:xylan 1,4-beta-xylosidase